MKPKWTIDSLPDSDMTVMMRLPDKSEFPVWPGYHDGERWCSASAEEVEGPVLGWMTLEDAAKQLDWFGPDLPDAPAEKEKGRKQ